ncbi:MAG: radical SAM protein [Planctomycetes bacterium]|nr:radical SAM protein [Planctomycetota bacterium]
MDTHGKLEILADASRHDLACACGTKDGEHRVRAGEGRWLHPVSLPSGGQSVLLKTLVSSACVNDCRYCPLRAGAAAARCSLEPAEIADVFMDYHRRQKAFGLFLSSGVVRDPDTAMSRLVGSAEILRRRHRFRGYIHLKIIPGCSQAAMEEALSLASAVSLNVEAPHASAFGKLGGSKNFERDIVGPMRLISKLTSPGGRYAGVKNTTQFIVGAADETDGDIIKATFGLYRRLNLNRVYYSAYQRGLGDAGLPGEQRRLADPDDMLTREHRLYQAEWLIRKYRFTDDEIPLEADGNLSLRVDPKTIWADKNPQFFPLSVNRADRWQLLRVPGLGPTSVGRILDIRRDGGRVSRIDQLGRPSKRLANAATFLRFD